MTNRISVGISISDKEYADALAKSLSGRFDVILSGSGYTESAIFLTDKPAITGPNVLHISSDKDTDGIYKFEGARRIEKHIIHTYCNLYDDYVRKAEVSSCSILGVCSPYGGSGCTTIGIAIGRSFAADDKKTLFLTLDDIPFEEESSAEAVISLNRLLFIMEDREFDLSDLDSCIWKDRYGLSHLKYMKPYNLLTHMKAKDLQKFISQLAGFYDCIVIDLGSKLGMISDSVLELCRESVYVLSYGTDSPKLEIFRKHFDGVFRGKKLTAINRVSESLAGCDYDMVLSLYDNPDKEILEHLQEVIQ